ncbi:hypothetical protein AB0K00_25255 [Dactylosporangium sp. NPDC049525]|uniref:hypothetical protein n=1 Tax=Dactylosporangium sp. NPDC049525 TaxID=3154730 RepID=UPI00341C40EB
MGGTFDRRGMVAVRARAVGTGGDLRMTVAAFGRDGSWVLLVQGDHVACVARSPAPTGGPPPVSEPLIPEPPGLAATCVRDGLQWRIGLAGRSVLVGHSVGMLHLAVLLANPGTEVPAVDLAAGVASLGGRNARAGGSTQPVLDRAAVQEYRRRLDHLRTRIEELEDVDHVERAAELRSERDWLVAELAAAAGLGGRTRQFSDDRERARLAVGRAIRRAVARVARADPVVGGHLQRRIHTGNHCLYRPGGVSAVGVPVAAPG